MDLGFRCPPPPDDDVVSRFFGSMGIAKRRGAGRDAMHHLDKPGFGGIDRRGPSVDFGDYRTFQLAMSLGCAQIIGMTITTTEPAP